MEKELVPILSITSIAVILIASILNSAFKNGKFTCNRYILNTYLYVVLAIIFISLILSILKYKNIFLFKSMSLNPYLFMFILLIGLLGTVYGIVTVNPQKVLLKHTFWLLFVLLITVSFLTTLILVLTLTAIAFARPDLIKFSWGPVLFFALLAIIVLEVIVLLVKGYKPTGLHRAISYIVIFIFMGYLLYDTKMMQVRAKQCIEGSADYIRESVNIFLDLWNIFLRILSLNSTRN